MSIKRIEEFVSNRAVGPNDTIVVSKAELREVIKVFSAEILGFAHRAVMNKTEQKAPEPVEPKAPEYILMDGSKYKSRLFNDRYMTVENVTAAINTFKEDEILVTEVAERVANEIIPAEQRRKRIRDVSLSKITKSRMNSILQEITNGHITSELGKFMKDRVTQKHGRWIIKK